MTDEECIIDFPNEPQAIIPKASMIAMEEISPRHRRDSSQNLVVVSKLSKGKFPVFLAADPKKRKKYAMKIFSGEKPVNAAFFQNEIQFASLCHPNIIRTVKFEQNKVIKCKDNFITASYIATEFAPHGDLFDFILNHKDNLTEKLCRTYFHQLIDGLEFLHCQSIAHLDIKLENLLIGEDYRLKIADFDLSCSIRNSPIITKGTRFHRSPELRDQQCKNGPAADIYSAGIVLFILFCRGIRPHTEDAHYKEVNLYELLHFNNPEFWKKHCEFQSKTPSDFSRDFRNLFNGMTMFDPEERMTIQQIKESRWYNGPIYTQEELKVHLSQFVSEK